MPAFSMTLMFLRALPGAAGTCGGEPCSGAATGRPAAPRQAAPAAAAGSGFLSLALEALARLAGRTAHREARRGGPPAPARVQAVLDVEIEEEQKRRPTQGRE